MANSLNQPLAGSIEPVARTWGKADPALKKAFYEFAGQLAIREKRSELTRAIGKTGRRMKPRKRPRPDGAEGPVMTPHDAASRTDRLLAARATERTLTLFWHAGMNRTTRTPWGTILAYHAEGKVKGAPVRDVRLSTRGITRVKKVLAAWWTTMLQSRARERIAREREQKAATATGSGGLASGVTFTLTDRQRARRDVLIRADVVKLEAALARTPGLHVGPGGLGPSAVKGRYAEARAFLARARREGVAVNAVEVTLGPRGKPAIDDGRHRFAALRDSGARVVPVAVPRSQAARFKRLYGAR